MKIFLELSSFSSLFIRLRRTGCSFVVLPRVTLGAGYRFHRCLPAGRPQPFNDSSLFNNRATYLIPHRS
ncbi:MAG: hypothetical protein ABI863_02335 [Ginsengibacter sp.]